ncbi:hypothetical protein LSCM1_05518 [Leishmania martiniquensis]|uniref:non-specific serine/threonine protein kinase n=1 Tax=Leishmania martiniquensis TaxID=1580590 RepID=A0A836HCA1_9TRYP|nr:hypothetical protein LSCM1_05518 [Leishmania martiniquensis]
MFGCGTPLNRVASDRDCFCRRHRRRSHSLSLDASMSSAEESDHGGVMQDLEEAAAAAAANADGTDGFGGAMCAGKVNKGLLTSTAAGVASARGSSGEDLLGGGAGANASRTGGLSRGRTAADSPSLKSGASSARRGRDEVDVAAKGIPIEVRRFQCTKSILALKEATKNDASPVPTKLMDFIVSLTSYNGVCTQKEMCDWLVAQMCDRIETGQLWVIVKTSNLLFALLWRGSRTFIESIRAGGGSLFQVSHLVDVIRHTPQENISGERLPCSLQPIKQAAAGQRSAFNREKPTNTAGSMGDVPPPTPGFLERLRQRGVRNRKAKLWFSQASDGAAVNVSPSLDLHEREIGFFISNTAYMESLCEYRFRHPTLDLAHGEILCDADDGSVNSTASSASGAATRRITPVTWKELLDDTLELIKSIATTDPRVLTCPTGMIMTATRIRNAVLLYQVACRALVRLVHSILTSLRTLVNSAQTGLGVPGATTHTASAEPLPSVRTGSGSSISSFFAENSATVDVRLPSETARRLVKMHYGAIYQFNRTVRILKSYCKATEQVSAEIARKAAVSLKLIPEDDFAAFRDALSQLQRDDCAEGAGQSHLGEQPSSQATGGGSSTSTAPPMGGAALSALLLLYEFHATSKGEAQPMWSRQVDAVCALFEEKESAILHQIFQDGLDGLWGQWRDFTNNGMAAAEKALRMSSESTILAAKGPSSSVQGILSSDGSAPGSVGSRGSGPDATAQNSARMLRSPPAGVPRSQAMELGSSDEKLGSISPDNSSVNNNSDSVANTEKSSEMSIEALLQDEDVVVICNEECSCNDTLQLVNRFQVLLDIPLGQGSYGKVFRAWDEMTGCYLAAKELPLDTSKAPSVAVREVLQEYSVLTELSHPNIVRVVAFMVMKEKARIYMEWMPSGSLQDVLRHHPRGALRESIVRRYARDVVSGLVYLHSRGVIHRDVKPANMLLSSDGTVKLTDFGTSLVFSGNSRTLESGAIIGTAAYMAPECVQGTYSPASDIWSFGCSVVQLITGHLPWYNAQVGSSPEPIALLFKIGSLDDSTHLERPHDPLVATFSSTQATDDLSVNLDAALSSPNTTSVPPTSIPALPAAFTAVPPVATMAMTTSPLDVSAELIDMLNAIFAVDRKQRPTARELLRHPFFTALNVA